LGFFGVRQRRGTHVSVPKIGSRVGVFCFGGILGFHADLRREFIWGNLSLVFFEGLGVYPRESIEEGGQLVCLSVCLGEFNCVTGGFVNSLNTLRGKSVTYLTREGQKGEPRCAYRMAYFARIHLGTRGFAEVICRASDLNV
jgi:hypothetical protein